MKSLKVKEIWGPTIQGEGAHAGWPSIFVRFAGCNMWSGKLEDRKDSMCPYCDTDFHGGKDMSPDQITKEILKLAQGNKFLIVLTGGEPLLQNPDLLCDLCKNLDYLGFRIQVETNGSVNNYATIYMDYVCCSPKLPFDKLKIDFHKVTSWKILYPHPTVKLEPFINNLKEDTAHFYLQPITEYFPGTFNPNPVVSQANLEKTIKKVYELGSPWKLSIQTHHLIGVQ